MVELLRVLMGLLKELAMQRLWVTIVSNETAEQAVKRGKHGALLCAVLFAALAVDGWLYRRDVVLVAAIFAAMYSFAAWRIYRGSAVFMEFALICLLFGIPVIRLTQHMPPEWLSGYTPFLYVLIGFELLNGVRGVSYLHALLGLPRHGGEESEGEIGVGVGPRSPLRPRDARTSDGV
jgi:hypothetical protein